MKKYIAISVFAAALLSSSIAAAEVPFLLPVVGHLTDSSDVAITGDQDVVFRIYQFQTGGSAIWAETFDSTHPDGQVSFDDGMFHVYLGGNSGNPLDIDDFLSTDELWLGIQVGTDNEMSRIRMGSVPWAFEAEVCQEVNDLDAAGIQAAIDVACPSGQYMTGYDSSGAVCDSMALPSSVLQTTDIGGTVQGAIDTSTPCNYGIATIDAAAGTVGCSTQAVVNDCGPLAGGGSDNNYLGSDGNCHPASHACADGEYLGGDEACHPASHSCAEGEVMDGNGNCYTPMPVGMIVMWSGDIAAIPSGWALCDGTNGTPNLVDRFIVGAGAASTYSVGNTGGANTVTLTVNQIPSHNHGVTDPGHSHHINDWYASLDSVYDHGGDERPYDDGHNSYEATTTDTTGISINNTGGGESHENRPPYYALAYIMRISY